MILAQNLLTHLNHSIIMSVCLSSASLVWVSFQQQRVVFDCNVVNIFVNIYFLHRYSGVVDLCLAIFMGQLGGIIGRRWE